MALPTAERWISELVPGKTFADLGGVWGTDNEQVTVAARAGATSTTMIDRLPTSDDSWDLLMRRATSLGVTGVKRISGNIDDPELPAHTGSFDVVHCSGVLYHCPQPMSTLQQLRRITADTLILGTATMSGKIGTRTRAVRVEPGSALFVPAMTETQRAILGDWIHEVGAAQAAGVNAPLSTDWEVDDYSAWWWFFTPEFVRALLTVVGFEVSRLASYWGGRATLFEAKVNGPVG